MDDIFEQFFGGGGGGFPGGGFRFQTNFGGPGGGGGRQGFQQREPQHPPLFENSDVIELNLGSVFQFYRRQEIWIILFYDVSKKESQDLKQEYITLSEKMFGILKVGAIDCKEEEELCEEFQVYETPTIKTFTENANDDGEIFRGKKEWKAISGVASNKM